MIDFPVSDDWRDYYYEIGLTPFPSSRYYRGSREPATSDAAYAEVKLTIKSLANRLKTLEEEVKKLRQRSAKPKREAKPKGWAESHTQ
jgi:hypothetical protein